MVETKQVHANSNCEPMYVGGGGFAVGSGHPLLQCIERLAALKIGKEGRGDICGTSNTKELDK